MEIRRMFCSQWKLQVVILWLLGGCIGSLIKDKSTFGLAADSTYFHDLSPTDHHHHSPSSTSSGGKASGSVKYLHSSGKKQNVHSSSSSSSSNSIYASSSGNSGSASSSQPQHHNSYNQHHHGQNNYRTINDDNPPNSDEDFSVVHHGHHITSSEPTGESSSSLSSSIGVQEKLRSTKVSGGMSSFGGSTIGGGSGGMSSSPTGLDHHHLHQHQQRERHHHQQTLNQEDDTGGGGGGGGIGVVQDGSNNINTNLRSESTISGPGTSESWNDDGQRMEKSYGVEGSEQQHQHQHHHSTSSLHHQNQVPWEQQEKLLLQQLMRGYERDVRPVRNASQPVVVQVGITLTQIFDMDEKNQVLTTNVWLDQEWNDELLRWDPKDFSGLEMIRIPCERIWLPDIVLYNNADDYTRGYMPSRAMVKYDGNVFWPPPTKFRSTCAVDVTYFPFDDQTCSMKLGSWTYNGYQVDVTNRTERIDLDNYVTNGEWDLLRADIQRNVVYYPCCTEPFPDVTITLVIRRKTLYYIYNIVLPCMMLSALTLLVFCLPPDSGEKIALGITVLLAFSVFMLAISEALPETSESIPLIGIYLTAVMAITSISVIVTVVVLNLHYLGPRVRPVPAWLKCLLPEDDLNFIRQKSMLIPATHREPRSGSLKRGHVYIPSTVVGSDKTTNSTRASAYRVDSNADDVIKECSSTESIGKEKSGVGRRAPPAYEDALEYSSQEQRFRKRQRHRSSSNSGSGSVGGGTSSVPSTSAYNNAVSVSTMTSGSTQTTLAAAAIAAAAARRGGGGTAAGSAVAGGAFVYPNFQKETEDRDNGKDSMSMCEDLVIAVRYLMTIQEQVESQNVMVAEWRLVAQAVDRILFWIIAIMTIFSSTVLLLILPLYKRSTYYGPPPGFNSTVEDVLNITEVE